MLTGPFPVTITHAANDLLFTADGQELIDLFSAHGTALLGHAHPKITAAVAEQLQRVWITGGLETPFHDEVRAAVQRFLPEGYRLVALYSTGMEAAEFALRLACRRERFLGSEGRGVVGFSGCMHGKSLATALLGWGNPFLKPVEGIHRLPGPGSQRETELLGQLEATLVNHPIGAVFVEPVQGCDGARSFSADSLQEVQNLCHKHDALLILDEILTGFYRTGTPFYFSRLPFVPDVILIGKAMGNGFPVSGVVAHHRLAVEKGMLPGSTYAGNPLAAAAVAATLRELGNKDIKGLVSSIDATIRRELVDRPLNGVVVRGLGAFWMIELIRGPTAWRPTEEIAGRILERGVAMGFTGPYLRLLPAATITPEHLLRACRVIHEVLAEEAHA